MIKIQYQPEIYDHPELCEMANKCKFLDGQTCILFSEYVYMGDLFYEKHDKCREEYKKVAPKPLKKNERLG